MNHLSYLHNEEVLAILAQTMRTDYILDEPMEDPKLYRKVLQLKLQTSMLASAVLEAWNRIEALDTMLVNGKDKVDVLKESMATVQTTLTRARNATDEKRAECAEMKEHAVDADVLMQGMVGEMIAGFQQYVDLHPDRVPWVKEILRMVIPERYQWMTERLHFASLYSEINERKMDAKRLAQAREKLWPLCDDHEVVEQWISRFFLERSTPEMGKGLLQEFKQDKRLKLDKVKQEDLKAGIAACLSYSDGASPSNVGKWL